MTTVTEILDAWPVADDVRFIPRREDLLLQKSPETAIQMWHDYALLKAVHFPTDYVPAQFSPPKDVFGGDAVRVEWQQMNARQPFYHRNADVDEISFQVCGERTLMTELGTVELRPGDFSRIPVGVAHDNYGREDVHILFYIISPATETGRVTLESEVKKDGPFLGWKKAVPAAIEMMTECLGDKDCDIAVSMADEDLLLDPFDGQCEPKEKLLVQRPLSPRLPGSQPQPQQPEWMYKSANVWIGHVTLGRSEGNVYNRHRGADAIHYQIRGSRMLVTQRGTIEMEPGDFISIPKGCAYTSLSKGVSEHIVVLTSEKATVRAEYSKEAVESSIERVEAIRKTIPRCNNV
ncbi:hypothetical protein BJX61DRAFT_542920 [Aspergillus egyptiacus]|nr:hypothetical protein BJX61DRAFT_542920 [Aspergillus egyptiacus]